MRPLIIEGHTRIVGKGQGYLALPLRDERVNDPVNGPDTPQMVTAWEVMPNELECLNRGAPLLLAILGQVWPPVLLSVGKPAERVDTQAAAEHVARQIFSMLTSGALSSDEGISIIEMATFILMRAVSKPEAIDYTFATFTKNLAALIEINRSK